MEQARRALASGETPVGCVIVRDDVIVSRGHNMTNASRNGTRHAEMIAIDGILAAGNGRDYFSGCTLYVSCEPCIMCAGALGLLNFRNVVYGCANDKFGGNGSILSIHKGGRGGCGGASVGGTYPSVGGLMRDDAILLLQKFYISGNPGAPKAAQASRCGGRRGRRGRRRPFARPSWKTWAPPPAKKTEDRRHEFMMMIVKYRA